jgi:hypothetical protein
MAAIDAAEANRHDRLAADAWGFAAEVAALGRRPEFADWDRRAQAARSRLFAGSRTGSATGGGQQVHPAIARGLGALQAGDRAGAAEAFRGALAEPGLHPLMRAKLQLNLAVVLDGEAQEAAWQTALAAYEDPRIAAPHRAHGADRARRVAVRARALRRGRATRSPLVRRCWRRSRTRRRSATRRCGWRTAGSRSPR